MDADERVAGIDEEPAVRNVAEALDRSRDRPGQEHQREHDGEGTRGVPDDGAQPEPDEGHHDQVQRCPDDGAEDVGVGQGDVE